MKNLFFYSIVVILLFLLFRPDRSYEPSQEEIQSDEYVDKTKSIQDFPYPQISRTFKRLSHGKPLIPLSNTEDVLPSSEKNIDIIRETGSEDRGKTRMYLPDYYRKDRLSGDPDKTEELRPFLMNKDKSENSWTDQNISEHPKFYNSDTKDELTNIGSFFDKNNNYVDKTSANTDALVMDGCYTDTSGNRFCEDNTRLQLIPPRRMNDPNNSLTLNTIGPYKNHRRIDDKKDSVINGGIYFDNIKGSTGQNETFKSFDNRALTVSLDY